MTRCRILALLRSMLRKSRSWGYLAAVPEFRLFREQHRIRFLSEDEAEWLTIASSGELKAFVVFLLNTALRPGEARRLEWGHVEADSVVVKGKGGKLRRIPLNRKARAALDSLDRDSENVFHSRHNVTRDLERRSPRPGSRPRERIG